MLKGLAGVAESLDKFPILSKEFNNDIELLKKKRILSL